MSLVMLRLETEELDPQQNLEPGEHIKRIIVPLKG